MRVEQSEDAMRRIIGTGIGFFAATLGIVAGLAATSFWADPPWLRLPAAALPGSNNPADSVQVVSERGVKGIWALAAVVGSLLAASQAVMLTVLLAAYRAALADPRRRCRSSFRATLARAGASVLRPGR